MFDWVAIAVGVAVADANCGVGGGVVVAGFVSILYYLMFVRLGLFLGVEGVVLVASMSSRGQTKQKRVRGNDAQKHAAK